MEHASPNSANIRRRMSNDPLASSHYGTNEGDTLLQRASIENTVEDGHPFRYYMDRRRAPLPWYRKTHQLILLAIVAWVGGVMYLANLAHAILRSQKENNPLMSNPKRKMSNTKSDGSAEKDLTSSKLEMTDYNSDPDYREWLKSNENKYGADRYGMKDYSDLDADYKDWLDSATFRNSQGDGGSGTNVNLHFGMDQDLANPDAGIRDWQKYQAIKATNPADQMYGASQKLNIAKYEENQFELNDRANNDADFKAWLDSGAYRASQKNEGGSSETNVNVRFGIERDQDKTDSRYKDWLEYQMNTAAKFEANGQYGASQNILKMPQSEADNPLSSEKEIPPDLRLTESVSNIDWPMKFSLPQVVSKSSNVTVMVVYGPEYHTHISEMAWNVATGVHAALQSHIHHHPHSPLHGHILYGHTSNLTFLDVLDADAIIIGSPVYNGNIHPDVQNWINYWHIDADLSNKIGGAFVTAGGIHAGAEGTIMSILRSMMVFQMIAVGGDSWTSPFGVAATMYEDPFGDVQRTNAFNSSCYFTEEQGKSGSHLVHPYFLRKAYGLGERIANVTVAWKNSTYVKWR